MRIITIYRDSRNVKINRNYISKYNLYLYFLISDFSDFCWFPVKKCWCQKNSRCVLRDSYVLWIFFGQGISAPSFIIVGYVFQNFGIQWITFEKSENKTWYRALGIKQKLAWKLLFLVSRLLVVSNCIHKYTNNIEICCKYAGNHILHCKIGWRWPLEMT